MQTSFVTCSLIFILSLAAPAAAQEPARSAAPASGPAALEELRAGAAAPVAALNASEREALGEAFAPALEELRATLDHDHREGGVVLVAAGLILLLLIVF